MYLCMYVHVYVYIYIYIYIYILYICMYVRTYVCMYVCTRVYACTYVCMNKYMCIVDWCNNGKTHITMKDIIIMNTVEPLLKNSPNKGHHRNYLPTKDPL